jgi:hypothetical protein
MKSISHSSTVRAHSKLKSEIKTDIFSFIFVFFFSPETVQLDASWNHQWNSSRCPREDAVFIKKNLQAF